MINLAVTGGAGRMGKRIIALVQEAHDLQVNAAMEAPAHPHLGQDIGEIAGIGSIGVLLTDQPAQPPDAMIDFSTPASTENWLEYCVNYKVPLVVGTTGLSQNLYDKLFQAAQTIPLVWAANMSLGVNLLFKLVKDVAQTLPDDYDIEIVEAHHRYKKDAPSGTAMELARQISQAKSWPWPDCLVHGRSGSNTPRQTHTIGMHAIRGGDIIGEHTVVFSTLGETVELRHRAHNRDTFVRGALRAVQWIVDKQPGLYTMLDVLEI